MTRTSAQPVVLANYSSSSTSTVSLPTTVLQQQVGCVAFQQPSAAFAILQQQRALAERKYKQQQMALQLQTALVQQPSIAHKIAATQQIAANGLMTAGNSASTSATPSTGTGPAVVRNLCDDDDDGYNADEDLWLKDPWGEAEAAKKKIESERRLRAMGAGLQRKPKSGTITWDFTFATDDTDKKKKTKKKDKSPSQSTSTTAKAAAKKNGGGGARGKRAAKQPRRTSSSSSSSSSSSQSAAAPKKPSRKRVRVPAKPVQQQQQQVLQPHMQSRRAKAVFVASYDTKPQHQGMPTRSSSGPTPGLMALAVAARDVGHVDENRIAAR